MIEKNKKLLLRDICARLPYGVKCEVIKYRIDGEMVYIRSGSSALGLTINNVKELVTDNLYEIKPYLFPLESITEEQKEDLLLTIVGKEGLKLFSITKDGIISNDKAEQSFENFSLHSINFSNANIEAYIDWLHKNHFDYRGLIPMGLANDATGLSIY